MLPLINTELRQQLLQMELVDRAVRAELAASGELFEGYAPRMETVHTQNARQLEAIIERFGWPGRSLVGEDGAQAAWFVVQHAIGHPAFVRRCLSLLRDAVTRGEAQAAQVAYLADRICYFERRPQRYGTQFDWSEEGQLVPWDLEDTERVDEYRQEVGLEPLAQRLDEARKGAKEGAPTDRARLKAEEEKWARSVGWLSDSS
jgi:hypothetical protein